MKKTFNIIIGLAALIFAAASCQKEEQELVFDQTVVGQWHLVGAKAEGSSILKDVDVYLCINADSSFELYQKTGSQASRYDLYTGTCHTEKGVLTGVYSNGKSWGGKYKYSKTATGLLLSTTNNIEEQEYISCQVPAEVKENANLTETKAASTNGSPIL